MNVDRLGELRHVAGMVSRETLKQMDEFEVQFRRWSSKINLAAPSTLEHLWQRHILDSAQLVALKPTATKWLDVGSGGGFPGAIIAFILMERPGATIELVESNQKKAAFLKTVLGAAGAPATVHVMRIEDAPRKTVPPQVVTARALAPLPQLLTLVEPWLTSGATALLHKGRDYALEVAESRDAWRYDLIEHVSKVDPASRILEISNLQRASAQRSDETPRS